ncbi:MAG TPA: nicotinate-nucleotide--dimethylbenzimidazole phosphoribosyltransferase, partial [Myxococcaceae bacterium]|nr:nicotinate-nucleotide--dimethylbenzimidazole phosphoribosyltransferase [Myxococcaceae bacterium]
MTSRLPRWSFPAPSEQARRDATARQARLTKPPGSLGVLEVLAIQLAAWQGRARPSSRPACAILFASDHPVVRHGVSAYPSDVTAAMVRNFLAGGAAASVTCRSLGVPLRVVDVGVAWSGLGDCAAPDTEITFRRHPVAEMRVGDLRVEDAMAEDTYLAALEAGTSEVETLPEDVTVLVLGEMGIGNTTVASAVAAALLGLSGMEVVGPGTGVTGAALQRKAQVVQDGIDRVGAASPHRIVQALGGREVAAMIGAAARALEKRIIVLVDGFTVTAAALALVRLHPEARAGLVFAHRSAEPAHQRMLEALEARPLLDLKLRLGEGSGALAALPLLDLACAIH